MIHVLPELGAKNIMAGDVSPPEEEPIEKIEDHTGVVLDVALSDDMDDCYYMASVGNDYSLHVYHLDKKVSSLFSIVPAHDAVVPCVTFGHAKSASLIFTGGWDHLIKVWNLNVELLKELKGHHERITDLCVNDDGVYVECNGSDEL